eukprot:g1628.t1
MSKRTSSRLSGSAVGTPGFQFTKKRRVYADADVSSGNMFDYDDVSKTPGLVVRRVTRSVTKARQQQQHRGSKVAKIHEPSRKDKRHKSQSRPKARESSSAGLAFPSYPSIRASSQPVETDSGSRAELVQKTVEDILALEVKELTRAYDRPSCNKLLTVIKDVSAEFAQEADRMTKNAMDEEAEQLRLLENPKNMKLQTDCDKLQSLISKLRKEQEQWEQVKPPSSTPCPDAQTQDQAQQQLHHVQDDTCDGQESNDQSLGVMPPCAAEMETMITFFAQKVQHMRSALQSVKHMAEAADKAHARMSLAIKDHTFQGYTGVKNPKSLLRGLVAAGTE